MSKFNITNLGEGQAIDQSKHLFGPMDGGNNRSVSRKQLKKAFGNIYNSGLKSSPLLHDKSVLGPFRAATSAGDTVTLEYGSTNKKYGTEANLVGGNNFSRLQGNLGDGMSRNGIASYSGNPRYVYDGSDYIRFKRLMAINKNFNDKSYGGNSHNQEQHAINRVRK